VNKYILVNRWLSNGDIKSVRKIIQNDVTIVNDERPKIYETGPLNIRAFKGSDNDIKIELFGIMDELGVALCNGWAIFYFKKVDTGWMVVDAYMRPD